MFDEDFIDDSAEGEVRTALAENLPARSPRRINEFAAKWAAGSRVQGPKAPRAGQENEICVKVICLE